MSWNIEKPGDRINGPVTITGNTTLTGTATISGDLTVDTSTLKIDATNNRVGVNTATPSTAFDVVGDAKVSANLLIGSSSLVNGPLQVGSTGMASSYLQMLAAPTGFSAIHFGDAGAGTAGSYAGYLFYDHTGNYLSFGTDSVARFLMLGSQFMSYSNGTASAPVFSMATDGNTGLYFPAADTIALATGGTERLRVDSSGNLGLGVTPSAKFDVGMSSGSGTPRIRIDQAGDDPYLEAQRWTGSGSNYYGTRIVQSNGFYFQTSNQAAIGSQTFTTRMVLDASGRLGIGIATPTLPLHVEWNGQAELRLKSTSASGLAAIGFVAGGQTNPWYVYTNSNRDFIFQDNTTERLRIAANGTVGLAVTPSGWTGGSVLMMAPSGAISYMGTTGNIVSNGYYGDQWRFYGNGRFSQYYQNNGDHVFYSSANNTSGAAAALTPVEIARINSSGRFAVGSAVTPLNAAQIQGTGQATTSVSDSGDGSALFLSDTGGGVNNGGLLLFGAATTNGQRPHAGIKSLLNNGGANGTADMIFVTRTATGDATLSEKMRLTTGGSLGIGITPASGFILTINGSMRLPYGSKISSLTSGGSTADVLSYQLWGADGNTTVLQNNYNHVVIAASSTGTSVERVRVKHTGQLRFVPLASDPSGSEAGDVYYNSTTNKLRCYNGSTWNDLF
jgi:hypothetical protein